MGKVVFTEKWNRRGDTATFIVIVIVVLVVVLFLGQKWAQSHKPDPDKVANMSPMREWELREAKPKPPAELRTEQPKITKALMYEASLNDANVDEGRGDLRIMISPDGIVSGGWLGEYYKNKKVNFAIQGQSGFEGKIYPAKVFKDGDNEDPSKLYFLARGERKFIVQVSNFEKGGVGLMTGTIYVRGWLKPDLSVEGDVVLDCDDNKTERFVWKADRPLTKGFSF